MLLEQLFLTELDWRDRSATSSRLAPFAGKGLFVHFSDIPKIGVNHTLAVKGPNKFRHHRDPVGIYFYPVDWLLNSDFERLLNGQQYGVGRPYFFITSINLATPGLTLSKTTWDDVERLARKNGWWEEAEAFRAQSAEDQQKAFPYYSNPQVPSHFLWQFVEKLERADKITWTRAFHGLSYIYDDNNSIIANGEPHQIVVLDPRIIRVVHMGRQHEAMKPLEKSLRGQPRKQTPGKIDFEKYRLAITKVMNTVAERYDGTVEWVKTDKALGFYHRGREPQVAFSVGEKNFRLTFSGDSRNFWLAYTFRRATGSYKLFASHYDISQDDRNKGIREPNIDDLSIPDIIAAMDEKVQLVASMKTDLSFDVPMQENEVKTFIQDRFLAGSPVEWKQTEIENDRNPEYQVMSVFGTAKMGDFSISPYARIYPITAKHPQGRIFVSALIKSGGRNIMNISTPQQAEFSAGNLDAMLDAVADYYVSTVDMIVGRLTQRSFSYLYHLYDEDVAAFKGWLAASSGLSLDGRITDRMASEIQTFEAAPNKDSLERHFLSILKDRF